MVRHQFQFALLPGRPPRSLEEHVRIAEAVIVGNPERAEAAMREHLVSVIGALREAAAQAWPESALVGIRLWYQAQP